MTDRTELRLLVASAIKESRKMHGLQQQDLARVIGVKRTSISNIEHGNQAVSLAMFCKIADALNEKPGQFLARILNDSKPVPSVTDDEVEDAAIRELIRGAIGKEKDE